MAAGNMTVKTLDGRGFTSYPAEFHLEVLNSFTIWKSIKEIKHNTTFGEKAVHSILTVRLKWR